MWVFRAPIQSSYSELLFRAPIQSSYSELLFRAPIQQTRMLLCGTICIVHSVILKLPVIDALMYAAQCFDSTDVSIPMPCSSV